MTKKDFSVFIMGRGCEKLYCGEEIEILCSIYIESDGKCVTWADSMECGAHI